MNNKYTLHLRSSPTCAKIEDAGSLPPEGYPERYRISGKVVKQIEKILVEHGYEVDTVICRSFQYDKKGRKSCKEVE